MDIQLPRTVDRDRLLAPLYAGRMVRGSWVPLYEEGSAEGSEYRREITRRNVMRFMLVYLPHVLRGANTRGQMSMSTLHVDMARAALRWTEDAHGWRDSWVAPRGAAKSTWTSLGFVLWALAHGWRRTVALYSDTEGQVRIHMGELRRELDRNDQLRADFPELIPDRRVRGTVDTTFQIIGQEGQSITARSMGSSDLGLKVAGGRPDLVILDDIEPDGQAGYTDRDKAARLEKIGNVILPMNPLAVVQMLGTVTRWGSLSHEVVRAAIGDGAPASWITGMRFRARYYPAIIPAGVDEDGQPVGERSLWPASWSLAYLQHLREHEPDNYRLNYLGQPAEPGGEHWTARSFRYRSWPTMSGQEIVHVDPAVTVTETSDETAVAVMGPAVGRPGVTVLQYCRGRRVTGSQLRTWLVRLLRENPHITMVVLEENAGGDWAEILLRPRVDGRDPWPASVRLALYRTWEPKRDRFHTLEGRYERAEIVHARVFTELERQMIRYPHIPHDDLMDTVAGGLEYLRNPHRTTVNGHPVYRIQNPADYAAA